MKRFFGHHYLQFRAVLPTTIPVKESKSRTHRGSKRTNDAKPQNYPSADVESGLPLPTTKPISDEELLAYVMGAGGN